MYLSDAVLRLMLDLYRGRLRPATLSPREVRTKKVFQPAEALRTGLASQGVPFPSLRPGPQGQLDPGFGV